MEHPLPDETGAVTIIGRTGLAPRATVAVPPADDYPVLVEQLWELYQHWMGKDEEHQKECKVCQRYQAVKEIVYTIWA